MQKSTRDRLAVRFGQPVAIAEGQIAIGTVALIILLVTQALWER